MNRGSVIIMFVGAAMILIGSYGTYVNVIIQPVSCTTVTTISGNIFAGLAAGLGAAGVVILALGWATRNDEVD